LVLNAGVALANTGGNDATGNESVNRATLVQVATVDSAGPVDLNGAPLTAVSSGVASNESDGEACVCTGDATATGNIAQNLINQDLDVSVGSLGAVVVPTTGVILNLGAGIANSGVNSATGNSSDNTATTLQAGTLDLDATSAGAQTLHNGGEAANVSDGLGKIGTGRATAIGNISATAMAQGATIDTDTLAVATLTGLTTNTGLGLANSGLNTTIGNDSTNVATLVQTAAGDGTVSNSGSARNESDGSARVGDPNCDVTTVTPGTPSSTPPKAHGPGLPSLPRTGGPIEVEAALGLMLLLAGFGLRRRSANPS
jgi:hypothetical protein